MFSSKMVGTELGAEKALGMPLELGEELLGRMRNWVGIWLEIALGEKV
jgi:hypothetical protein